MMSWCLKLDNWCEKNYIVVNKNVGGLVYKQCKIYDFN